MMHISLSWRLFFLLALFAALPIAGWYISLNFEKRIEQQVAAENRQLLETYHSILQKLIAEDTDFAQSLTLEKLPNQVTVAKRQGSILVDGYADEWFAYQNNALEARNDDNPSQLLLAEDERFLFGLLIVNDNQLIYREGPYSSQSSDMVRMDLGQGFWLFQAIAPGPMQVLREYGNGFKVLGSVYAVWQETQAGYNIEFRVPKSLVGDRLNAVLYDVDDQQNPNYDKNYQGVFTFTNFNYFPLSRETSSDWLLSNELKQERISIVNANSQVIYQIGDLFLSRSDGYRTSSLPSNFDAYANQSKIDNQFTRGLTGSDIVTEQVAAASPYFIARSAKKLVHNDKTLGLIILESSAQDKKINLSDLRWLALFAFILVWLLLSVLILKRVYSYRKRVKLLTELTEAAYENDTDIVDLDAVSIDGVDEVAQIYENLSYFNERLEQRRDHQQKLLARLNHELRTPLAIIGSSIDNLALSDLSQDDQQLIKNARAGLERLSLSFSRLSEANRLEESIDSVKLDWFEVNPLLKSLVESYSNTWPQQRFELLMDTRKVKVKGSEDLFAQMLDKLISNAVDFAKSETPIVIQLEQVKSALILNVSNQGPTIEPAKLTSIFNIMESQRSPKKTPNQSNLGLGLYIAKLIARRHKAKIEAKNSESNDGVILRLIWGKKSYVVL